MISEKIVNNTKFVIFDMDGVLINSEPVTMKSATLALAEIGIQAVKSDFEPYIGAGEEKFIIGPCGMHGKENLAPAAICRLYEIFSSIVFDSLTVYPSVHTLLKQLNAAGITMAIASSSDIKKLSVSLDTAKIPQSLFKVIVSGSEVTEKKPSPEIYIKTMEKLGAVSEECLIIEDALTGVQAAKAAGAKCFAVTTSFSSEQLFKAGADYVENDIIKALELLNINHLQE